MSETLKTATAAPPVSAHESKVADPPHPPGPAVARLRAVAARCQPAGPPARPWLLCAGPAAPGSSPGGLTPRRPAPPAPLRRPQVIASNDKFVKGEYEQQQMIIKTQDQHLEDIEQAVTRLGRVGLDIHKVRWRWRGAAGGGLLAGPGPSPGSGLAWLVEAAQLGLACPQAGQAAHWQRRTRRTRRTRSPAHPLAHARRAHAHPPPQELEQQGQLLDELDEDIDTTHSRLKAAQKKMLDVLKRSGTTTQLAVIGFLLVVLIILSVFAFY
jgi:hypothetical protein